MEMIHLLETNVLKTRNREINCCKQNKEELKNKNIKHKNNYVDDYLLTNQCYKCVNKRNKIIDSSIKQQKSIFSKPPHQKANYNSSAMNQHKPNESCYTRCYNMAMRTNTMNVSDASDCCHVSYKKRMDNIYSKKQGILSENMHHNDTMNGQDLNFNFMLNSFGKQEDVITHVGQKQVVERSNVTIVHEENPNFCMYVFQSQNVK